MMRTLARVLFGFVLACIAAGLTQVLFVITPAKLLSSPANVFAERATETGVYALLTATHAAIFSAAFALIAVGIGEWMRVRSMAYYLAAGMTIALLGFVAQYSSEVAGQPSIFNGYAVLAYLTSGFFAGLVYWIVAGRRAGGPSADDPSMTANDDGTIGVPPPTKTWKTRPRIIVDDYPKPGTAAGKKATLAERLGVSVSKSAAKVSDDDADSAAEVVVRKAAAAAAPEAAKSAGAATPAAQPSKPAATSVPATKPASPQPNSPNSGPQSGPAAGARPGTGPETASPSDPAKKA